MAKGLPAPPAPSRLEPTSAATCPDRRASSSLASPLTARKIFRQPSLLSSAFPYLRRLDTGDDLGCRHLKSPLLSLKLSSVSFLNSSVSDGLSRGPLYTIETAGSSTSILRTDPWEGPVKTADIRWPTCVPTKSKWKDMDGVLVQMRGGRWKAGTDILKASNILSCRKFNVPNYPHCLKWKRTGITYQCTSTAVKGPIATFDPAVGAVPAILFVYETLHDRCALYDHGGVSIILLDYLVITALLLVTEVLEWKVIEKPAETCTTRGTSDSVSYPIISQRRATIASDDSLYNKATPPTPSLTEDASPRTPSSTDPWASIDYGEKLNHPLSVSTHSNPPKEPESVSPMDSPSPSAESIYYSLTTSSSAPSHTYFDPLFYGKDIPPVPQIPRQYRSTSSLNKAGRHRELPTPPSSSASSHTQKSSQPWPRLRSPSVHIDVPSPSSPSSQTPLQPYFTKSRSDSVVSLVSRRLPQPPRTAGLSVSIPDAKRSLSLSPRSLPPTPVASSSRASRSQHHDADKELADWFRSLTSHHHVSEFHDIPPPAYDSINFSTSGRQVPPHQVK